jgi:hypothetical protein
MQENMNNCLNWSATADLLCVISLQEFYVKTKIFDCVCKTSYQFFLSQIVCDEQVYPLQDIIQNSYGN